jgi:pilus assembly protein Flp/PilA
MEKIKRFFKDEEGVTTVEYGLIAAIMASIIIAIFVLLEGGLTTAFTNIAGTLTNP